MADNKTRMDIRLSRIAIALVFCVAGSLPVANGQDASSGASEGSDMLQLFMTNEQRRLLEAVRQGLLRDDELDRVKEINTTRLQEFEEQQTADVVEVDDFISFDNPVVIERGRSIDLNMGGFIRIGDRNSSLLVNGEFVEADEISESLGIDFNQFSSEAENELVGVDLVRQQRVVLKPGQTLPTSGNIRENLYVINPDDIPAGDEADGGLLESVGEEIVIEEVLDQEE